MALKPNTLSLGFLGKNAKNPHPGHIHVDVKMVRYAACWVIWEPKTNRSEEIQVPQAAENNLKECMAPQIIFL